MTVPGMVLSHPDNATTPSNKCPRATSSIESAITSRLINEAFIPSVPIEMPSDTAMVLYSMGVPPAALMPAFTRSDNRRRWKLQGMTSIQVLATPMMGRDKSSSVNPMAFNIARAGARSGPTSKLWLVSFNSFGIIAYFPFFLPFKPAADGLAPPTFNAPHEYASGLGSARRSHDTTWRFRHEPSWIMQDGMCALVELPGEHPYGTGGCAGSLPMCGLPVIAPPWGLPYPLPASPCCCITFSCSVFSLARCSGVSTARTSRLALICLLYTSPSPRDS